MPLLRTSLPADAPTKLDELRAAIAREAEGAEPDPFDVALIAAVSGIADALRAEGEVLAGLARRARMMGRRVERGDA